MRTILYFPALLLLAPSVLAQEPPPGRASTNELAPTMPVVVNVSENVWLRGEYLPWMTTTRRGLELTQELTSNPLVNSLLATTNTTDEELTRASFEGKRGFRLTAGAWLDPINRLGVEASVMWLYREELGTPTTPADYFATILPGLTGAGGGGTFVISVSAAGAANARLKLELSDQEIFNYEVIGRVGFYESEYFRFDGLLGARYLVFEESLALSADVDLPGVAVRSRVGVDTRSTYVGAVLGLNAEAAYRGWFAGARPRATIASVNNEVTREAIVRATVPVVGTREFTSAILGDPTQRSRTWTVLPELDVWAGRQFGDYVRLMIGGSVLVLPDAVRASGQLNPGLPIDDLVPGAGQLLSPQNETMYLITMSVGLELRF